MDAYAAGSYGTDDLEHGTFHRTLLTQDYSRLFLNPSQLVIYGRRHRFSNRLVAGMLRGWSRLRRRSRSDELFARSRRLAAGPAPAAPGRAA